MTYPKPYSDQKNWSNTYLTDPKLLELLGPFDTDPCCPEDMPWKTASLMYTEGLDGLSENCPWVGRVFMNPPYRGVLKWASKFVKAKAGIALLNGRSTETKATQLIMDHSKVIWFPHGRLTFYKTDGTPWEQKWFPSLLIGLSEEDEDGIYNASEVYGGQIYYK